MAGGATRDRERPLASMATWKFQKHGTSNINPRNGRKPLAKKLKRDSFIAKASRVRAGRVGQGPKIGTRRATLEVLRVGFGAFRAFWALGLRFVVVGLRVLSRGFRVFRGLRGGEGVRLLRAEGIEWFRVLRMGFWA